MDGIDQDAEIQDDQEPTELSQPGHPLLAVALVLLAVVGAWHGLMWVLGRSPDSEQTAQMTGMARVEPAPVLDSVVAALPAAAATKPKVVATSPPTPMPAPPRKTSRPDSAVATRPPSVALPAPAPDRSRPGPTAGRPRRPDLRPPAPDTSRPKPLPATGKDSLAEPALSPFRRSHPWAAAPGQRYYYPTRCAATLRFPELLFFRTQAQARASGFVPAPGSGCG